MEFSFHSSMEYFLPKMLWTFLTGDWHKLEKWDQIFWNIYPFSDRVLDYEQKFSGTMKKNL